MKCLSSHLHGFQAQPNFERVPLRFTSQTGWQLPWKAIIPHLSVRVFYTSRSPQLLLIFSSTRPGMGQSVLHNNSNNHADTFADWMYLMFSWLIVSFCGRFVHSSSSLDLNVSIFSTLTTVASRPFHEEYGSKMEWISLGAPDAIICSIPCQFEIMAPCCSKNRLEIRG